MSVDLQEETGASIADSETRIYFDTFGRPHSLYSELLDCPPSGVRFVVPADLDSGMVAWFRKMSFSKLFAWELFNGVVPPAVLMSFLRAGLRRPQECSLTYATGHIVFREEDWIVDSEHLGQFVGYNPSHLRAYSKLILKRLESDRCRKILPWSKMAYETITRNIGTKKILGKTEIVRLARRTTPIKKTRKEHTEILFIGSVNFPSILSLGQRSVLEGISRFTGTCSFASLDNFESKGGREVFEVFSILSKKYDRLRLTVRARVPPDIHARYASNPSVRLIENTVSQSEMEKLFLDADIFLFPSHMTPGMAFLDAMNYELPIVTIAACNNAEIVQHGKTGLVCPTSKGIRYWHANGLPAGNAFEHIRAIRSTDPIVTANLVSSVRELIENDALRTSMGKEGRRLLETGEFSTGHRNQKLRRIVEQALHR